MVKLYYGLVGMFCAIALWGSSWYVAAAWTNIFNGSATKFLDHIYNEQKLEDTVQHTAFDHVSSNGCNDLGVDERFTVNKTLCYIKQEMHNYFQYLIYAGLSAAVIFLIWNGFKIVTSSDKENQMKEFKRSLKYLIIWVILLVSFYAIIEIFTSIINLISPGW
jgi:hypothetical protein